MSRQAELSAEIETLRGWVKELADGLERELRHHIHEARGHPRATMHYQHELDRIAEARRFLQGPHR